MQITTTHGTYSGRTLHSIIRREYGRDAGYTAHSDPNEPGAGYVTRWAPKADGYHVLARVKTIDPDAGSPEGMTSAEVVATRHLLGLSMNALSEQIGIGIRSIKRWESGDQLVSAAAAEKVREVRAAHDEEVERMIEASEVGAVTVPAGGGSYPASWWVAVAARALDRHPDMPLKRAPTP